MNICLTGLRTLETCPCWKRYHLFISLSVCLSICLAPAITTSATAEFNSWNAGAWLVQAHQRGGPTTITHAGKSHTGSILFAACGRCADHTQKGVSCNKLSRSGNANLTRRQPHNQAAAQAIMQHTLDPVPQLKLQVLSDIHLEFGREGFDFPQTARTLALVGDIGDPGSKLYEDFLLQQATRFQSVRTCWKS